MISYLNFEFSVISQRLKSSLFLHCYDKPRDERMTYAIAVLKEGRSDAAGRKLRTVRKLDYKETRTNEQRREENSILGEDRGKILITKLNGDGG
jgi:hypothetical protein